MADRGRTGEKVEESGAYKCGSGTVWSYSAGQTFRPCPETGEPTMWYKTGEPNEPDAPQR